MSDSEFDKHQRKIGGLLADLFEISAVYQHGQNLIFSLNNYFEREKSVDLLHDRLKLAGYRYTLDQQESQLLLNVDPKRVLRVPPLNIILFIATLISVYFISVYARFAESIGYAAAFDKTIDALKHGAGIEFTIAMISILFVHEMGHFLASRRRNIITSFPYFIPAPNIIGTFGAIIKSKTPFWNRRDLIEVGAAGPIAGWIVAVAWLIYGLTKSVLIHSSLAQIGDMGFSLQGESILMRWLTASIVGTAPNGYIYILSEAAYAGWVGLLITAINMLPIGQLDGGHVLYGLFRRRQHILGYIAMGLLVLLGFKSLIWWIFAIFGLVFGIKHPPTIEDNRPISTPATVMGVIAIMILIVSFTPMPFPY